MSWEMRTSGGIEGDEKSLHKYTIIETTVPSSQMEPRRSLASSTPRQWYIPTTRDCSSDKWLGQILAIVFSLCCSVSIVATLLVYDKHPVPKVFGGITLNAVISVLATASKGALLFTIASCLGQLKWSWLKTNSLRALSDLELFDSASRGPLGAVDLMCKMEKGPTILLGALLTLTALGFDPFVQQVLTFESGNVYHPSTNVTAPQVRGYLLQADSELAASAIYSGIWGSDFTLKTTCDSGNCTFDPFESIGWCSKCREDTTWIFREDCSLVFDPRQFVNASDGVDLDLVINRTCTLVSPAGRNLEVLVTAGVGTTGQEEGSPEAVEIIWIDVPYQHTGLVYDRSLDDPLVNISFETAPLARWAFIHFKVSNWSLEVDTVTLCDLDFCLRNESIAVTAGMPTANVLSAIYGRRYTQNFTLPSDDGQVSELLCWNPKDTGRDSFEVSTLSNGLMWFVVAYSPANFAWCNFMGGEAWDWPSTIDEILESKLARSVAVFPISHVSGSPARVTYNGTFNASELDSESWVIDDYESDDTLTGASLLVSRRIGADTMMDNIALSLTRLGEVHGNITMVEGEQGTVVTIVTVRWAWLILPGLVVLGTTLLLALTMLITHRTGTPVWKSLANALLYHGLDCDAGYEGGLDKISEMNKKAHLTQVRLVRSEKTGRLYLKTQ